MNRHLLAVFLGISPMLAATTPTLAAEPAKAPAATPAKAPAAAPAQASAAAPAEGTYAFFKAPLFSEAFASTPVARVESEIVTMEQLTAALASVHGAHAADDKAGKKDFAPVLDRLVNARLLVLEAREMGIDELPEFKEAVEEYRRSAGQELLKAKVIQDVKADPAELKRVYEDTVREWKVRSLLVYQERNAKAFLADLKAGKSFDALAKKLVADKNAEGSEQPEFLPRSKLLPHVLAALQKLSPGKVSPPLRVKEGWAIMEVHDVRYPEDPAARAQVETVVLSEARKKALQAYYGKLVKKHATLNIALLRSLDFEAARPGLAKLQKDRRVLASFAGKEPPITVSDLANGLAEGFFHGSERAAKEKKLNLKKPDVFDGLLARKVVPIEVRAQGIDRSPELDRKMTAFESNLLFTRFLEKAIVPEIKLGEPELKQYWQAHQADYSYPAFWRVESLAFKDARSAQAAIEKLRAGTDFKWLNANADGQLQPGERKVALDGVLAATTLPKPVSDALAGAGKGDYRLYASPEGQHYAIHVVDYTAPAAQPFEEVREVVQQRLYLERLGKAIEDWAGKLRQHRKVEVYITRIGS